jgi:UDP-glucose 4-epimerase
VLEAGADHPFQFEHVRDVASAITLAARASKVPPLAYNVSSGQLTTLGVAAELVSAAVPGPNIRIDEGFFEGHDVQDLCDLWAARADFGYQPEWSLEQGIHDYIAQMGKVRRN